MSYLSPEQLREKLKEILHDVGYTRFFDAVNILRKSRLGEQTEKRKPMSRALKSKLYIAQEGRCKRCGEGFSIHQMTDDHFIPLSRGGSNEDGNRRLVCSSCNSRKGNNLPTQESKRTGKTILEQLEQDKNDMNYLNKSIGD